MTKNQVKFQNLATKSPTKAHDLTVRISSLAPQATILFACYTW